MARARSAAHAVQRDETPAPPRRAPRARPPHARLVRLDADLWARDLLKDTCDPYFRERYAEIPACIGRDGLYLDRRSNTSWVELGGRAFVMDARQTRYDFEYLEVMRFNARQTAALRELVAQRMATPAQRALYHRIDDYQCERLSYRRLFARGVMMRRRLAALLAAKRAAGVVLPATSAVIPDALQPAPSA